MTTPSTDRYVVARADQLAEGGHLIVEVKGRSIGIFMVEGRYYALLNRCPHAGAELCRGVVVGHLESSRPGEYDFDPARRLLVCPWHGWEFDLSTGQSYIDPSRTRVRSYPVERASSSAVVSSVAAGQMLLAGSADVDLTAPISAGHGRLVAGPYVAETVPVAVEDDCLVLSLRSHRPRLSQRPENPGDRVTSEQSRPAVP
jgi:3-phenylpropionate/trans-cinnamate dioxygenase ferredoxin subunit